MITYFMTGENGSSANNNEKDRIGKINGLSENIGIQASLQDEAGAEDTATNSGPSSSLQPSSAAFRANTSSSSHANTIAAHRSSLCNALAELNGQLPASPSVTFNLANCAETNGRAAEAIHMLEKYMQIAPSALDSEEARARIADLNQLLALPAPNGAAVRKLHASVYGALAERKFDSAL